MYMTFIGIVPKRIQCDLINIVILVHLKIRLTQSAKGSSVTMLAVL